MTAVEPIVETADIRAVLTSTAETFMAIGIAAGVTKKVAGERFDRWIDDHDRMIEARTREAVAGEMRASGLPVGPWPVLLINRAAELHRLRSAS